MTRLQGRYTLDRPLGEGGMGVVYLGMDNTTETPVAIKKLRQEVVQNDPETLERFNREAEMLRALNHPNIVKAMAAFEEGGAHYIVMEYVEGQDLDRLLVQEGRLGLGQVIRIGIELADALTRAHYLRIIHRDLKPANVLLDKVGTPKLSDFGVAYLDTQQRVTSVGVTVGTPAYMAPEVLNNKPVDARADLWALGVILFEMLTGKHPFYADTLSGLLINVFTLPVPDLEALRPDCPVGLADLIYRMLERDPVGRVSSARIVGLELEKVLRATEKQSARSTEIGGGLRFDVPDNQTVVLRARNNLPAQTTPFIGRERELDELARLIAEPGTRLITVLGPGGMGKTRLALAAAEAQIVPQALGAMPFEHGIYMVELAPLDSPEPLVATLANAVGFQFSADGGTPTEQLWDYLRQKRMLLIFDNFEHVLGGVPVVNDLLRAAPGVKVVATSRERLNLLGETLYPLDGLDLPADISTDAIGKSSAAQLFLQSARRARPGFELADDDLPLVAEVCRTVGGLPLGIVLAAAWVQTLSLKEVLEELRTGLDFLETEMGDVPQRHRSIRSVFDYSWKLMRPEERDLVATLSVFRGGLSRRAGQEVAGAGLRALATLVNKSLLRRDPDVGSYHMHELLRQYAYSQLEASGRADAVRQAHSAYYLGVLAELRPALQGGDQIGTLYKLADDIENVRAAWDWALDRANYPLIAGALPTLSIYFELCGRFFEGEAFFEQAAAKLRAQPASPVRDTLLGELLARSCTLAITLHHREAADALLTEADALLGESAPAPARAALAFAHGFCHLTLKKAVDARPYFERAAELYRAHVDWWALARTLDELSSTYWYRADGQTTDLDKAKALLTEALDIQKMLGDVYGLATTTLHLGTVASYALDDAEDARLTAEALVLFQQINHRYNVAHTLNNMGVRELMNGQYSAARPYLEQSLHIRHEIGSVTSIAWGIFALSRLDYSEGDFVSVVKRTGEGLALVAGSVHVEWELTLLFSRAQARWALGEYPFALADYGRTDQLARQLDNQEDVLYTLNRRGAVALAMRDDANAAAWLSRAKAEAEEKDDQTTALLSQALLARLALFQGKPADAREQVAAPVDYFTNEEAWQMSYSTDQWQMSAYAVESLITLADARRVLGERAAALSALGRAFRTAQAIVSPAHLLSVAAAYAEVVAAKEPLLAARLSARVATHSAAYAVDKVRARSVLHRAASSKGVPPEAFAEACLTGEGMAFPALVDALADDLLAG